MSATMSLRDVGINKLLDASDGELQLLIDSAILGMVRDTYVPSKDPEKGRKVKIELTIVRVKDSDLIKTSWKIVPVPAPYECRNEHIVPEGQQRIDFESGEVTE